MTPSLFLYSEPSALEWEHDGGAGFGICLVLFGLLIALVVEYYRRKP
jgi:hypothetical protein